MAKTNQELQLLEIPKSRSEAFLDYICGRAVDLNALPIPKSRVEEYLEYLCYNRGQGGGGGIQLPIAANQVTNNTIQGINGNNVQAVLEDIATKLFENSEVYIEDDLTGLTDLINQNILSNGDIVYIIDSTGVVDFDGNNVNNDGQSIALVYDERILNVNSNKLRVLSKVNDYIKKWSDLEYVQEYPYANLMEYDKKITGWYYGNNRADTWQENLNWSTYFLDVKPQEQYTIFRRNDDSSRFIYTNSVGGNKIDAVTVNSSTNANGFTSRSLTVPNDNRITKLAIQFNHTQNTINDIVVIKNVINNIPSFIPFADGEKIQIGTEVSYKFDNSGSNLISTTYESAIKEIDSKAITINDFTDIGGVDNANKPVKLNANGVLDTSMIPDLALTTVHMTQNEITAQELINNGTVQVGDIVVLTDDNNKIYMCKSTAGTNFNDKFLELSIADGTVKAVNGQYPNDRGEVVINSSQISYDNTNSQLVSTNIKNAIDELNGKFVTNIKYEDGKLKQTINKVDLDITEIVTKWSDLEYVEPKTFTNLLSNAQHHIGKVYANSSSVLTNQNDRNTYVFNVEQGSEYILVSNVELSEVRSCQITSQNIPIIDGSWNNYYAWRKQSERNKFGQYLYKITTYNNQHGNYGYARTISFQYDNTKTDKEKQFMVYKAGDIEPQSEYIDVSETYYTINGDKVETSFHGLAGITSKTLKGALEELSAKSGGGTGNLNSINGETGTNGNIDLELTVNDDNLELKVNNVVKNTISLMTDQQANEIINLFV